MSAELLGLGVFVQIVNLLFVGIGLYIAYLLIKALRIYIKKNS